MHSKFLTVYNPRVSTNVLDKVKSSYSVLAQGAIDGFRREIRFSAYELHREASIEALRHAKEHKQKIIMFSNVHKWYKWEMEAITNEMTELVHLLQLLDKRRVDVAYFEYCLLFMRTLQSQILLRRRNRVEAYIPYQPINCRFSPPLEMVSKL